MCPGFKEKCVDMSSIDTQKNYVFMVLLTKKEQSLLVHDDLMKNDHSCLWETSDGYLKTTTVSYDSHCVNIILSNRTTLLGNHGIMYCSISDL